jgi:hypothetical protein
MLLTRQTLGEVFRSHRNPAHPRWRAVCAAGAVLAATGAVTVVARGDRWALLSAIVFVLAPDVPLLFAFGPGLIKGQLHPRSVLAYNTTHRMLGPIAAVAAAVSVGSLMFAAAGLAWFAHVLCDRAVGYGLRGRDGWQRGS